MPRQPNKPGTVPIGPVLVGCLLMILAVGILMQNRGGPAAVPVATAPAGQETNVNLLLGNPSGATADPSNRNNFLLDKKYFVLSYNDSRGTPNWVSWRLTIDDVGSARRLPVFHPDDELPMGFLRVVQKDYAGSGFDRGHMCPHSDRAKDDVSSLASFVTTNIIPQAPNVNRKAWAQLEMYCRGLVEHEQARLYICDGSAGTGGVGSRGVADSIADGRVVVPKECWKIVVVGNESSGDNLRDITPQTRVIAVIMPNDHSAVGEEWDGFRTSVTQIEKLTGYRYFTNLDPAVAGPLKEQVDRVAIPRPVPFRHGGGSEGHGE